MSLARRARGSVCFLLLSALFCPRLSAPAAADILVMDNFNDGSAGNQFGGGEGVLSGNSSIVLVSSTSVGNTGFGRRIDYDTTNAGGHGYFSARNSQNLTTYRYVSFWIRGAAGGENVYNLVDDNAVFPKVQVKNFLDAGITTRFQKVVVSTQAFYSASVNWGAAGGAFKIEANNDIASGVSALFIDDIRFGQRASPIWWDTFNDGAAPLLYGQDYATFIDPAGAAITPTYSGDVLYGTTGFSYAVAFTSSQATSNAVLLLPSITGGMDLTGTDALYFHVRGDALYAPGNDVGVGIKDFAGAESVVHLSTYLAGGLPTSFQEVKVPLSAFSSVDTTHVTNVEFWLQKSASPFISPTTGYTLYLENVKFVDTSTPSAPTAFISSVSVPNTIEAVIDGKIFNSTTVLTVSVSGSDPTLEEVRVEHDGLTAGTTWFTIATSTDIGSSSHRFFWYPFDLRPGATYQVRAVVQDVQGNRAFGGPYTVEVATRTPSSPTVSSFRVFSTSIAVALGLNGNPTETLLSVTTGTYGVSDSTSGRITNLTLGGLTPNTTYLLTARAGGAGLHSSSVTVTESTATVPSVPSALSFISVTTSTVTLAWSSNGNPLTPPTSYQVLISSNDPDFTTFSASDTFTTMITTFSLPIFTTYYFKIKAYGIGGTDSAFTSTASARTGIPAVASTPTALAVTAVTTATVTFSWTDNSSDEVGFAVLGATGGVLVAVATNVTTAQLTGLGPNSLVEATGVTAINLVGSSTGTASISSYTLANPPANLGFVSTARTQVIIQWSSNSNTASTAYEISQSTDNFSFQAGISTPVPFSPAYASTSAAIGSLVAGGTYYFRVRAQNGGGIATAFSNVVSTFTSSFGVINSTGGTVDAGATTVTADPGVSITLTLLADGTTEQLIVSTQAATLEYGSGIRLEMPAGARATVIASSNSLQVTSSGTIPISNAGYVVEATSGTLTIQASDLSLDIALGTNAVQNFQTSIPSTGAKTVALTLNPQTGPIKALLSPGTFSKTARLRLKLPDSFPAAAALRFAPGAEGAARAGPGLFAAASTVRGLGIGPEITLDPALQPEKPVEITIGYREPDVSGTDPEHLILGRFEESVQRWVTLETRLDRGSRLAKAATRRFSKFQLLSLSPASDVHQARVFPNPLRLHRGHTEMSFTNLTADASVKIYTTLGELLAEIPADRNGIARWNGRNTYGERVGSGTYVALLEGPEGQTKTVLVSVEK